MCFGERINNYHSMHTAEQITMLPDQPDVQLRDVVLPGSHVQVHLMRSSSFKFGAIVRSNEVLAFFQFDHLQSFQSSVRLDELFFGTCTPECELAF